MVKAGAGINCGPAAETNLCRRCDDCHHNRSLAVEGRSSNDMHMPEQILTKILEHVLILVRVARCHQISYIFKVITHPFR